MSLLYRKVLDSLAKNENLTTLLALLINSFDDDIPFPDGKLIGDWYDILPGQKVIITYTDPYRVEMGFLFTLPGFQADDIYRGGIIQIPRLSDNEEKQTWTLLKHAAIFADTIELETTL
jgi:hypothetical protein